MKASPSGLQNTAPNSNVSQKTTNSRVQQSMFMLLYALFISFPVRHTNNFRFDLRHCIGDLMTHAMIRNFLHSELTDKVLSTRKPKFQKKAANFADKTNHKNSVLLGFFIWVFRFLIDICVNGKIKTPLKSHCVVKLPDDER